MKKQILKIFSILILSLVISCKAQKIYPLITYLDEISDNSYIKDIDNEYDQFVGTWKANYDNKEITLKITKVIKKQLYSLDKPYYSDVLIVQHLIKDNNGKIIENYISSDLDNYKIISTLYSKRLNLVRFSYSGVYCGVGNGLIRLKKQDSAHLIWNYRPIEMMIVKQICPDYTDENTTVYLPDVNDLVFTKQ